MRKYFTLLLVIIVSLPAISQHDKFAFAVTDVEKNGASWNALRKLDLATGTYSEIILNGASATTITYDAATRKVYQAQADKQYGTYMQAPFATGVAAMAYDKRNNRLYYTPMFIDQLRYIDLRTMKIYYVTDQAFTRLGNMHNDEGKVVTRMTIAPDGYGYAVTNDGQTFLRFTTGKKLVVEKLGALVDAPGNAMSISSKCSSWGGDMIADDEGHLYIFSARNVIYMVDIDTRVASLVKPITGLPQGFTINGAVVTENNEVLVSSAVDANSWFVLDPKDWTARAYNAKAVYRSSDLANSNYLSRNRNTTPSDVSQRTQPAVPEHIVIYPNPVSNGQFTIQFGKVPVGNYHVEMTDMNGRLVMNQLVNMMAEGQVEIISVKNITAKGVYLVHVVDQNKKSVFHQKIVVQ